MAAPVAVDWQTGNADWQVFMLSGVTTGGAGLLLAVSAREERPTSLDRKQAFLLTSASWVVLPAFAALPFLGLEVDYPDAFFESVSGLTTTGATVLVGLDVLPPGILLWRSLLQWIGGIGIVVMAMVMLPFLKIGGMQLFHAESSDRSEKIVARSFDFVVWIGIVYVALTLACALAYAAAGMSAFDAVCHAMTTFATGGFSTHDASFAAFRNPALEWIGVLFMVGGALPFVLLVRAARGDPGALHRDPQVRAFVIFLAAVCFGFAVWLALAGAFPFATALRLVTFNVVSIVTTSGFVSADYTQWGAFAVGLFFFLMLVGGCTGSTAGAIKIYRFMILGQVIRRQLRTLENPSRVERMHYGATRLPEDVPPSVLAFLTLYGSTIAVVTLVLAAMGLDLVTALSSAVTAVSNVGPGLGEMVGPAGNFAPLPDTAKLVLAAAMILGRLELFTVFVLCDPQFWRW
jgi:trk system potassium uptake protein TrkH